jgi:tRNA A37 threonylcarbamoyladenosine dehydratase
MLARAYDKRVEIWGSTDTEDGFGGFVLSDSLIIKRWANIETKNSNRDIGNGKIENFYTTIFKFRGINNFMLSEKFNYIKYKDIKFVIDKIENINLVDIDIIVYCTATNGF